VNVAIDVACMQARLGHTVALVSGGGDFDEVLRTNGVEHIQIDQSRRPLTILRALMRLRGAIKTFRPEIVHAHMMTGAGLAFLLRRFMDFKFVTTVHNEFEKSAIVMGLGDRVVGVSQAVAESMARRGVAEAKLRVVLNGTIGSPRLDPEPPAARALQHPALVFVGGIHPRKGVDDLIAAFKIVAAKIPEAHLYLVGYAPDERPYREQAAQTGVGDRIEFCGGQRDPRPWLRGADIFILASHAEPAALVLPEAREAGCAIVATDVGGTSEMLDHGKAGLLVPPHRPDLLADALLRALTGDHLLAELKKRAKINLDYYTVERASRDYLGIYAELLAS
jgi:glycosyltransferase involved in cell wall biosynthesis